jgi:hypothetical protein
VFERVEDFSALLRVGEDEAAVSAIRHASAIGRPLMEAAAVRQLERQFAMTISPRKRGPKPKSGMPAQQTKER